MIRALLFDLGDVLVGLEFERAWRAAARLSPLDEGEIREKFADRELAAAYETGAISSPEFHRRLDALLGMETSFEQFAALWTNVFAAEPLLSESLIETLGRGRRLLIVSNTNELHFEFIRRRYPILGRFDDFTLSYRIGVMKPAAAIFRAAIRDAGCGAEECFFTDDKAENVEAARQAGIDTEVFRGQRELVRQLRRRGIEA